MAALTAGNIVVYRAGSGAAALSSAATAVFLDEYTPSGTLVQSIALPTATSGANNALTASGSASSEGLLTDSADGRYLLLTGYNAAPGTASVASTTAAADPRVIGRVDATGAIDTATVLTGFDSGNNIRGVASTDGSILYVAAGTGIAETTIDSTATPNALSTANARQIEIVNGQIYYSTGSGAQGVYMLGSVPAPTSGTQTSTLVPGTGGGANNGTTIGTSPYAFAFAKLSATSTGNDTLYVADSAKGIEKFSLVGGTWVSNGIIANAANGAAAGDTGLALAVAANGAVNLYLTNPTNIESYTDSTGYNGAITTGSAATLIATAATNTVFRGVAFAPQLPTISIADASIAEGDSGTKVLTFTVTASAAAPTGGIGFTVNTADGTATAGSDYVALANATGTIAAGQTTGTVSVTINGDTTYEANETFTATLGNATNATIARATATGTIINDDAAPSISIADASVIEGNSGTTNLNYTVTLSATSGLTTTVNYATADGTATAGSDYVAANGTLTFAPGVTSKVVSVVVNGDTMVEPDETVLVNLSSPSNATIVKGQGTGTIVNDDAAAPTTPTVDISQVYGGGGNAGATYKNDFVELYNYGTTTVSLSGWSIQYTSATGTSWQVTNLTGSILPGHYYLVQEAQGTGGTTVLPMPDATGTIGLSGTAGKVALSSSTAAFTGSTPTGSALVDFVGFGATANAYEGSGPAPAPSNTTADIRTPSSQDTNNNAADFITGAPNPRNSATAAQPTGPTVSINSVSTPEGNSGTKTLDFTVTRSDTTTAFSVDVATSDGTATAGSDYVAKTQTLTFAANGAATQTFSVTINGDTIVEPDETFTATLSNLKNTTGATALGTASGTGTIQNDDFNLTPIYTIQGSGFTSPLAGQKVSTSGIVTAVDSTGYYLQDPTGDGNSATSDGIFVFTSTAPTVAVGDSVDVSGTVQEYKASTAKGAFSVTELSAVTATTVLSHGNALPAAVIIGPDGVLPPTSSLAAGNAFYESLEGMRVTVENPVSVGPTNSFGEIFTVANNGVGATGLNSRGELVETTGATPVFGSTDSDDGDFNPERIKIDGSLVSGAVPSVNTGTHFANVTGILNYDFDNFGVSATAPLKVTQASTLTAGVGTLAGDATHLTFGSYNIENFSSTASVAGQGTAKVQAVADQILVNLNSPDIVALQEVQDNSGPTDDGTISASTNLQNLVNGINAKGGAQYAFIDNPFIGNDTNGGQPGGNIRTAFLYRTDVPGLSFVAGSLATIGADGSAITSGPDTTQQTSPNNPFYQSRPPLSAQFMFNGQVVTIVDTHFTSKGGSGDLEGSVQPSFNGGEVQRAGQAQAVNTYVDGLLAANGNAKVIVTGDLNEFTGEEPLDVLEGTATISNYNVQGTDPINATATYTPGGTAVLTDLESMLPADQQFDYNFQGNAESLVHTLTTGALTGGAQFQPIHINSDFAAQTSDHDPLLASFTILSTPAAPVLSAASDSGSSQTDGITNVKTPTVTGTANAGSTVTLYDTNGTTVLGTTTASTIDGSYTITSSALADGAHSLTLVSSSGATSSARSQPLSVMIDTTAPSAAFTSKGGTTNRASQVVNGTVDVADAGSTVSIYEDGGTNAVATATVGSNGQFSATVALGANGQHTLTARDTDVAGNVGTTATPLTYNLDTTAPAFTAGNLVISISGDGDGSGIYTDNQATPLVLQQITTSGAFVSQIVLPQTTTTVNGVTQSAVSAEYGSSSEGLLALSADGHSLVIGGYGVNAQTYNSGGAAVYGDARLAQSTSVSGGQYTPVARVVADVNANGTIDTSTAVLNIDNTNNIRSIATVDGSSFYISGQGKSGDTTQGLFLATDGATSATRIDGSTDTRVAAIYNGQLYVSRDSKQGTGGTSNISVYGSNLPTTATTGTILQNISQNVVLTAQSANSVNAASIGSSVNLDPEAFFFANANTLYVADGGIPKQGGAGDGGLQKWTFDGAKWNLAYTLSQGLNLAATGATAGTTGLIGLTGQVVGNSVQFYATNQTAGDTDQKYVFAISDQLAATTNPGPAFSTILAAAPDTNIRGIAFAPTPIVPTIALAHDTGISVTDHITSDATITYTKAVAADTLLYAVNNGAYSTSAPTFASDGTYTVAVEEQDKGGNVGAAATLTFTLDRTADAGGDLAVRFGTANASAAATPFTLTGLDANTSATVTFSGTASGGGAKTVSTTETANGTFTVDLSGFQTGAVAAAVTATDVAGNSAIGSGDTTTIGRTPPAAPSAPSLTAASDTGASASDGVTKIAAPTVTGTAQSGTTVTIYDGTIAVGSAVAQNGTYTITSSMLTDGAHTLTAKAADTAGNISQASAGRTIVVDTMAPGAPSLASTSRRPSKTPSVGVTGAAEAGATVSLYDGSRLVGTTVAAADGSYSLATAPLANGKHTLDATATDTAGNVSAASAGATVTVAAKAPPRPNEPNLVAASDTGRSSHDDLTGDNTPTLRGRAQAGSTVTLYDGKTAVGTAVAGGDGIYAVTASALTDGRHRLDVTASNGITTSAPSKGRVVFVDTQAPAAPAAPVLQHRSDTGASSSDSITADRRPTLTGTAEAGADVTLYDGGQAIGHTVASARGGYAISVRLGEGAHSLSVGATDAAGNASAMSGASRIVIDRTAPAVSIEASSTAGAFTGHGEAGTIVTVRDNGHRVVQAAAVQADGTWSADVALKRGRNHLVATDADLAGNVGRSAPINAIGDGSLHRLVQAMSTMPSASSAASSSPTATAAAEPHPLAASH